MKILRTRTIAHIYPFLSLEAEIELDDGKIVYSNISVNNRVEKIEVIECDSWTYFQPLDEVDWHNVDDLLLYPNEQEEKEICSKLIEIWNNNPVFNNDYTWKEFCK